MKIDIADAVCSTGEEFDSEYHGAMPGIEFLGEKYDFPDGIHVTASWRYDGEGIIVTGSFKADTPVTCARCLETFTYTISFRFAEYYKKQPEEGMYGYEDETIDLMPMLEDNVVVNLPTKVICREDCKGLCSQCGADLNKGRCSCSAEPDNTSPFAQIDWLSKNNK